MKLYIKENFWLTIFYFLFIFILLLHLFHFLVRVYPNDIWQISDWLINYQGGFVRRGLAGNVLLYLYHYFGLSPYVIVLFLCVCSFIALILFFVKSFIENGYTIFILPFVFFLGCPIIHSFVLRKEDLLILIFILTIYFSIKKSNIRLLLVNLFFVIGLLIHETIGFFCFPILLLIFINNNNSLKTGSTSVKSIILSLLQLSPAIVAFLLCLYYHGSPRISNIILNSWKPISLDDNQLPNAIDFLSWSLKRDLLNTKEMIISFNDDIFVPITWFFTLLLIYYLLTNVNKLNSKILNYKPTKDFNKISISSILIFQILAIVPLFILGIDYGRWIFYWVTSSFSIIILIPGEKLSSLFPKYIPMIASKINNVLDSIFSNSKAFIYSIVFLMGVPLFKWTLSNYLETNPIIIVLRFISMLTYHLILFIHAFLRG